MKQSRRERAEVSKWTKGVSKKALVADKQMDEKLSSRKRKDVG